MSLATTSRRAVQPTGIARVVSQLNLTLPKGSSTAYRRKVTRAARFVLLTGGSQSSQGLGLAEGVGVGDGVGVGVGDGIGVGVAWGLGGPSGWVAGTVLPQAVHQHRPASSAATSIRRRPLMYAPIPRKQTADDTRGTGPRQTAGGSGRGAAPPAAPPFDGQAHLVAGLVVLHAVHQLAHQVDPAPA